jgi:hypothetical protein
VEPVYVLRPAAGVTVRVDSALAPEAPSHDVRAWLSSHLVPYEG